MREECRGPPHRRRVAADTAAGGTAVPLPVRRAGRGHLRRPGRPGHRRRPRHGRAAGVLAGPGRPARHPARLLPPATGPRTPRPGHPGPRAGALAERRPDRQAARGRPRRGGTHRGRGTRPALRPGRTAAAPARPAPARPRRTPPRPHQSPHPDGRLVAADPPARAVDAVRGGWRPLRPAARDALPRLPRLAERPGQGLGPRCLAGRPRRAPRADAAGADDRPPVARRRARPGAREAGPAVHRGAHRTRPPPRPDPQHLRPGSLGAAPRPPAGPGRRGVRRDRGSPARRTARRRVHARTLHQHRPGTRPTDGLPAGVRPAHRGADPAGGADAPPVPGAQRDPEGRRPRRRVRQPAGLRELPARRTGGGEERAAAEAHPRTRAQRQPLPGQPGRLPGPRAAVPPDPPPGADQRPECPAPRRPVPPHPAPAGRRPGRPRR